MSITDKLPEAPEGFAWKVSVFEGHLGETLYVSLEQQYLVPSVTEGEGQYAFVDLPLSEEKVVSAGVELVERFERRRKEARERQEREDALKIKYAHLLTD